MATARDEEGNEGRATGAMKPGKQIDELREASKALLKALSDGTIAVYRWGPSGDALFSRARKALKRSEKVANVHRIRIATRFEKDGGGFATEREALTTDENGRGWFECVACGAKHRLEVSP